MEIIPFDSNDIEELLKLQPDDWTDLRVSYRDYLNHLSYCNPVKVVRGGRMVGIGTTIFHSNVAWLAHIVVHPDYRNEGIGRFLTKSMIDNIDQSIFLSISLIATSLGQPVYSYLGFKPDGEYKFFKTETGGRPDVNQTFILPLEEKHRASVYELDLIASGEDRSSRLIEFFSDGYIYLEGDKVHGFYLPSFSEGLIVASHTNAGLELMKKRIATNNFAVLPAENMPAIDLLLSCGFVEYRKAKRMYLEKKIFWKSEMIYNRVSGQVG